MSPTRSRSTGGGRAPTTGSFACSPASTASAAPRPTRSRCPPATPAVDLGCGTGANLRHLRDRVGPTGTVVGVDLTPGMLARAESRVERAGWQNVHLVPG
ncbi:class I SAM-dependent methyltransferase [Halobacterium bonnevillei]|uniref:class I SAM-dependent methyltransferase n=1 Tax=Halobacterium bonnevillei TaxID=2692200 RepID=UPI001F2FDDB0|nr:class I SAM-dependent methyltransferase [Halobacterium bonnevillei]